MSSSSSDNESSDLPSDASLGAYKHALRTKQAANNRLIVQLSKKDKQIADITNQSQTRNPSNPEHQQPAKRSKYIWITDPSKRLDVQTFARKFTYMRAFWLQPADNNIFHMESNPNYDPKNRFISTEDKQEGLLFDLLMEIPAQWHSEIGNRDFIQQFLHEMSQQRSNACSRLHQAGPLILGCTNDLFNDQNLRASTFKELIGFTGCLGEDGKESYKTLAPILYKDDPSRTDKKWTIFRHPLLMKTYSALVRGPGSIKSLAEGQVTHKDSHASLESKWGIDSVTPGAIAMAAILARFVGSGDQTLLPRGSVTGINYQHDYDFYFQYLHKGLHTRKACVIDIFKTWNDIFYPNASKARSAATPADAGDLAMLLDELDAEEDPEEDEIQQQAASEHVDNPHPMPSTQIETTNATPARSCTGSEDDGNATTQVGTRLSMASDNGHSTREQHVNVMSCDILSPGGANNRESSPLSNISDCQQPSSQRAIRDGSRLNDGRNLEHQVTDTGTKQTRQRSGKRKAIFSDEQENVPPDPSATKRVRRNGRPRKK